MGKNYKWGIMGAGKIAEKFCTALSFVDGSEVYAIASRDAAKARTYAAQYGAKVFCDNYTDLVSDDNIDIIYIATPHSFHHEQAMLCFKHKKAVLCEKPMSVSRRLTAEMIAAAAANKLFLMEGLWTACMPFIEKIKELIQSGVIGKLQYVSADFGFSAPKDSNGRLYNKALGGGSVLDVGIYSILLPTLLLGAPSTVKSVSQLSATGIDEYANIVMHYPSGETAHALSSISFNTSLEARIAGTKGNIHIDNPWFKATDFSTHLDDGTTENFSIPHLCNGFEYEIKEVMACLDNGLLQSDKVPHSLSLSVSKIMDEVLRQAGVIYDEG